MCTVRSGQTILPRSEIKIEKGSSGKVKRNFSYLLILVKSVAQTLVCPEGSFFASVIVVRRWRKGERVVEETRNRNRKRKKGEKRGPRKGSQVRYRVRASSTNHDSSGTRTNESESLLFFPPFPYSFYLFFFHYILLLIQGIHRLLEGARFKQKREE